MSTPPSFAPISERLRADGERFRDAAQRQLYATELQARSLFPLRHSQAHLDLAPSLAWVLERSTPGQGLSEPVRARMRQLGLDHRRHGFPADTYDTFADALVTGLSEVTEGVDKQLVDAAESLFRDICTLMADSTREADLAGVAPAWVGEVTSVTRHSRRISVVTLESGQPFSYEPGQWLPVSTNYLPGTWRMMTPATPASEYGTLELHIRAVKGGKASTFLTTPRRGDLWSFGAGRGDVRLPNEECIVVAYGTGWAAVKALLIAQAQTQRAPVHLLLVAEYPGEHYDWPVVSLLEDSIPWLRVTPVVADAQNPWWLKPTGPRPESSLVAPTVEALVTENLTPEQVKGRQILVIGPDVDVDESIVALSAAGIPWIDVDILRFGEGPTWAPSLL